MINRKLASLRTLYNINQSVLAELIQVSINTYSSKERGVTSFNQKEMIEITNFFRKFEPDITMDDIFFIDSVNQTVTKNKGA